MLRRHRQRSRGAAAVAETVTSTARQTKLLRMIAMTVHAQTDGPDKVSLPTAALSFQGLGFDLADTTAFLSCRLFSDYVSEMTESRLAEAKAEKDPIKCYQTLITISMPPSLPDHCREKILIGINVFDTSTTKATRVKRILQNPTTTLLVHECRVGPRP